MPCREFSLARASRKQIGGEVAGAAAAAVEVEVAVAASAAATTAAVAVAAVAAAVPAPVGKIASAIYCSYIVI